MTIFKKIGNVGTGRVLIWGSLLAIAGFLLWANWAELDQITRANGQVITQARNQVIQVIDGGVLEVLPVREGAVVKRGQLLLRLVKTKAETGYLESASKAAALKAVVARINAELIGGEPKFPPELSQFPDFRANQLALLHKRLKSFLDEVAALEKVKVLLEAELDLNLPLLKSGDVSHAEIFKLQRQVLDVQAQITNRRNKHLQENQIELAKAHEDLAIIMQTVEHRKEQLESTEVRSPMDGVVRNVRVTTIGAVVKPGEEIMQIVPVDDDLIIEAKVKPVDIAFIKAGLPAKIKLDAYDYAIYGTLDGIVSYISVDTLHEDLHNNEQPFYRVQIKTHVRKLVGSKNDPIEMQPGMTATVEIKTGKKTVLSYLSKPVTKTLSESMRER